MRVSLLRKVPAPSSGLLHRTRSSVSGGFHRRIVESFHGQTDQKPPSSSAAQNTSSAETPQQKPTFQPQQQQQQPLIYPSAPSPHHTSLTTFLAYATRTGLDQSSTVYVGTHFEYTTAAALSPYGFSLRRVGGSSDGGIDLLGVWTLPRPAATRSRTAILTTPLRVLAQCKAIQQPGPHLIRELEGAFASAPAGWRGTNGGVIGALVAERLATKGIREALARSRWPMVFVACSRAGYVEQLMWNRRAEDEGLEGYGVGMKYNASGDARELVLTWKGRNLPLGPKETKG
ncbi:uncharacterized protein C8A04DRAFT_10300 [Dichotomopilus funicola]|uniref:Uncharacterized protein n=1 Tax=Dichotomopilus funicola TaxID=1934379 RepID=A0AAN6ZPB1_9PEZI|nr:hypothetical protein C8A04DRAFT_10300 [Dichotomopilus funicola]